MMQSLTPRAYPLVLPLPIFLSIVFMIHGSLWSLLTYNLCSLSEMMNPMSSYSFQKFNGKGDSLGGSLTRSLTMKKQIPSLLSTIISLATLTKHKYKEIDTYLLTSYYWFLWVPQKEAMPVQFINLVPCGCCNFPERKIK